MKTIVRERPDAVEVALVVDLALVHARFLP